MKLSDFATEINSYELTLFNIVKAIIKYEYVTVSQYSIPACRSNCLCHTDDSNRCDLCDEGYTRDYNVPDGPCLGMFNRIIEA